VQLGRIRQKQDAERRRLVEVRDVLRNFMSSYKEVTSITWLCSVVCGSISVMIVGG